jgi:hypothetical protein
MNEDYLWDKTGEPDPEIELLERKLTSLRFKRPAEPLPLPAVTTPPRYFFRLSLQRPALAAAAALVALLLAAGLWLGLRQPGTAVDHNALAGGTPVQQQQSARDESGPAQPTEPQPAPNVVGLQEPKVLATVPKPRTQRRSSGARPLLVRRQASPRPEELARRGEEAKAQLIKALHVASDKLNEVQKKIRGGQEQGPTS